MFLHINPRCLFVICGLITNFVLSGCAERPKEAPTDFQELTSFLYEHLNDEDPEELQLGLENMFKWLNENPSSVQRGYTVKNLSQAAIDSTGKSANSKDLIGGAVLTAHGHDVLHLARALGIDNEAETNGDSYIEFKREFQGDAECFARLECDTLSCDSRSTANFAGIIEVKYDSHVEFRWVNTSMGPVMIHRSFMNKNPEISVDFPGVEFRQGFYLGIAFPPLQVKRGEEQALPEMTVEQETNAGEDLSSMEDSTTEDADQEDESNDENFMATVLGAEVDEAVIPSANHWGSSALLQVNWLEASYGLLPVTEDRALEMLVDGLIDVAVATEKWMDSHYTEE